MLVGCSSRVLFHGHLSEPYEILQGTRQGSILAPFFYTVFINDLLADLSSAYHGFRINDLSLCAPTQADDMVLLSPSRSGLNELLKIGSSYANKWRFSYNASKCAVMTLNKSTISKGMNIVINNTVIREITEYKHLGIQQCSSRKTPCSVDTIRQTARGTLFSFLNSRINYNSINPITTVKLYMSIVLPRAFFACELWNNLCHSHLKHLESTHHFCLKRLQDLPNRTRSDMVKGLLGFISIEGYIDLQKLLFLGSLCRLKPADVAYKLLIIRVYQFMNKLTVYDTGYVKDIVRILEKYSLYSFLTEFLHSGSFPAKALWKKLCKTTVFNLEQRKWTDRIHSDNEFEIFKTVHFRLSPALCWRLAQKNPYSLKQMRTVAKVICLKREH